MDFKTSLRRLITLAACVAAPALVNAQTVIADWRLDELHWNSVANEIIDSAGTAAGQPFDTATLTAGKICRAVDLSANSATDYLSLGNGALNGDSDFTISVWVKTTNTGAQSIVSAANATQPNELLLRFNSNTVIDVYVNDSNATGTYTVPSISTGTWRHVVWTRSGTSNCIYVDGAASSSGCRTKAAGAVTVASGGLIIGQDQDSVGGGFQNTEDFEGQIDELLILDRALTAGEVASVFTNQNAGNAWNGAARPCATLIGQWRMDETTWAGTSGEVLDTSGNVYHGTAQNAAVTAGATPALAGNPGTCRYSQLDGTDDHVLLPAAFPNLQSSFTITAWIRTPDLAGDQRILVDDQNNTTGYAFTLGDGGSGRLRFFSRGVTPIILDTQAAVITANTWYFVAAVHNAVTKTRQIFVNGVAVTLDTGTTSATYTGNWGTDVGPASIGGETNASGEGNATYRFQGNIDDLGVHSGALTAAEITTLMNQTHVCASTLHHFDIDHDGNGINCLGEPVSVTAEDSSNAVVAGYTGTITLNTQSGTGSWALASGAGTLTDGTTNDGIATYAYAAGDNGVAQFTLNYPQGATPINIAVNAGAITDDNLEGTLAFGPSGFTVTASALSNPPPNPINNPIAAQTAGTNFSIYIAAYGQTPTDAVCGIIEAYTGNKSLKFWSAYSDPATGTVPATINTVSIAVAEGSSVAQTISFASGQVVVTAKYKDVGRISISMKDDTVVVPAGGIRGATNLFVVKPANFALSNIRRTSDAFANPAAANQNGAVFIRAGVAFSVTITARDAENSTTPNYGREASAESVLLTPTLVAAGGAAIPALQAPSLTFTNGVATGTTWSWGEVGIITLTPSVLDANYLGAGTVSGTTSGNVGRFTPNDFAVALIQTGTFDAACGTSFTYVGQSFAFATAPQVRITARNLAGGTTTNYDGAWWKLSDFIATSSHDGSLPAGTTLDSAAATHTAVNCAAGTCDGVFTSTFSGPYAYQRGIAPAAPFNSNIDISFSITDSDSISFAGNPFLIDNIAFSDAPGQRWGRLVLENTFGSELTPVAMPLRTEFFNGTAFTNNTADQCTAVSAVPHLVLGNTVEANQRDGNIRVASAGACPGTGCTVATIANSPFVAGATGLTFSAPGAGHTGYADVSIDLSSGVQGANRLWLRYDWDGDGSLDDDPRARLSFGIFAGQPQRIYTREPWD